MKNLIKPILIITFIGFIIFMFFHILFGNCQTTMVHYIVQCYWKPKYLPLSMQTKNFLMLPNDEFIITCESDYTGTWRTWHKNGQLSHLIQLKNGKADGISYSWFPNGKIERTTNWLNDVEEGIAEIFYENGQKASERRYKNGKKDGLETKWHANGIKKKEEFWEQGTVNGKSLEWYDNGNKKEENQYIKSITHGKSISWYENGFVKLISTEETGKGRIAEFYDENTGKLNEINYYNDNNDFVKKEVFIDGVLTKTEY